MKQLNESGIKRTASDSPGIKEDNYTPQSSIETPEEADRGEFEQVGLIKNSKTLNKDDKMMNSTNDLPQKRSKAACQRCKSRKTKCSGHNPCRSCISGGHECIYPRKAKRIHVLDVELEKYKEEIESLKNELMFYKNRMGVISGKESTPIHQSKEPGSKIDFSIWLGSASCELICWNLKEFAKTKILNNNKRYIKDKGFTISPDFSSFIEEKAYDYILDHTEPEVFNKDVLEKTLKGLTYIETMSLLDNVVLFINSGYLTVDPRDFRIKSREYFNKDGYFDINSIKNEKTDFFLFKMLMILTLGEVYSRRSVISPFSQQLFEDKTLPGLRYFKIIVKFIPTPFQLLSLKEENVNATIQVIELFGLIAIYLRCLDKKQLAVLFTLNALELGISINLHKEQNPKSNHNLYDHYNKIWWATYCLNRFYSSRIGQPLLLSPNEITRSYPQQSRFNINSVVPQSKDDFANSDAMRFYIELAKISDIITNDLYCLKQPFDNKDYFNKTLKIMERLLNWVDDIPDYLKLKMPQDKSKKIVDENNRLVYTLHLNYLHHIYLACIPILINLAKSSLMAFNQNGKSKELDLTTLPRNITKLITACINASEATINIFTIVYQEQLLRVFGFTDLDYLLSSSLIFIICMILRIKIPPSRNQFTSQNYTFEEYLEVTMNLIYEMKKRGNLVAKGKLDQIIDLIESLQSLFIEAGYGKIYKNLNSYGNSDNQIISSDIKKFQNIKIPQSSVISNLRSSVAGSFVGEPDFNFDETFSLGPNQLLSDFQIGRDKLFVDSKFLSLNDELMLESNPINGLNEFEITNTNHDLFAITDEDVLFMDQLMKGLSGDTNI